MNVIQRPRSREFCGTMQDYIIDTDETITFAIEYGGHRILDEEYVPDGHNQVRIRRLGHFCELALWGVWCAGEYCWQTDAAGTFSFYINEVKDAITTFTGDTMRNVRVPSLPNLYVNDFISEMPMAYGLADLVVSRAGAGSISEFCLLGKPVILVPSPNVAEDHQTKNALALVNKDAALYVKDADAATQLVDLALRTVADDDRLHSLSEHIARLALPDSADRIAKEVLKLIQQ